MAKNNYSWKMAQTLRDYSMAQGEEIVKLFEFAKPPINPFAVIESEPIIHAEGADFGDAFDGRLEYLGNKYLLAYNTKYNRKDEKEMHPRIRFTIAHELGHYFLDEHRNILLNGGTEYSCNTEFKTDAEMELQADYFATGFLMPAYILRPKVNKVPEPSLKTIQIAAQEFQVSMTSMLLRWVKLSDFPCGVFSIFQNHISWGWVSEPLLNIKAYPKKGQVISSDAIIFLKDSNMSQYREGNGKGLLHHWTGIDRTDLSVEEFYADVPYTNNTLVFFYAYEEEMMSITE